MDPRFRAMDPNLKNFVFMAELIANIAAGRITIFTLIESANELVKWVSIHIKIVVAILMAGIAVCYSGYYYPTNAVFPVIVNTGGGVITSNIIINNPSLGPPPNLQQCPRVQIYNPGPFPLFPIAGWKIALQLPVAYCQQPSRRFQCQFPIPADFTIHGLYALDYNGNSFSPLSDFTQDFVKIDDLRDFVQELAQHWPQLERNVPHLEFWNYQFNKHGRASGLAPRDYFNLALRLKYLVDSRTQGIDNLLGRSSVVPGYSYDPNAFCNALMVMIPMPGMKCSINYAGLTQLLEFQFCFSPYEVMRPCSIGIICRKYDCSFPTLYPRYAVV
ncbi:ribonuclease s-2 [Phtheirospermum japonicum]|uniref:Ribonuclease s-2 n=1 Tax=Phtheirospermum japonicum TaxID=374723 RepID=A0A830BX58_9LAMI|nr:ribonuclease s-2 [Phtheirospermum japonicum]